ncbi:MAG: hypothetical protein K1X72_25305 [Pyrinomonadaceae bacterium]|nr:hypothetical protein [Pyrinomonadaceae bacterium]
MAEGESTASNFIWAFAFVIIVALIVGALYFGGFVGGTKKHDVDIKIDAPATR